MANRMCVEVGCFAVGGNIEDNSYWGFVASDDYASLCLFFWESEDEFYKRFPTPKDLWNTILHTDQFDNIEVKWDDEGSVIMDENGMEPKLPDSFIGVTGFYLSGFEINNPYCNAEPQILP